MKLAIIGLLAIFLLGGGAAGAYFYFEQPAEAAVGPADEAAKAAHDAKVAETAENVPLQYVELNPLILPVIGERGVTQTVSLVVSLEVPDAATAEEVKRLTPRLQDAFIQDMYGALSRKNSMKKGVLQVAPLKARLNRITTKVMGEGKVNDVLLQVVQQRRI
jgi:flagellar FliL protein